MVSVISKWAWAEKRQGGDTHLSFLLVEHLAYHILGFPCSSVGKESAMLETWVQSLDWEAPLEKGNTHSSTLVWRIPRTCIVHGVAKSWT